MLYRNELSKPQKQKFDYLKCIMARSHHLPFADLLGHED